MESLCFAGNLDNWWEPNTTEAFETRASCFVDQYNQYQVNGLNLSLNGNQIQGEVIADNGGIAQAYDAYGEFWLLLHKFALKLC